MVAADGGGQWQQVAHSTASLQWWQWLSVLLMVQCCCCNPLVWLGFSTFSIRARQITWHWHLTCQHMHTQYHRVVHLSRTGTHAHTRMGETAAVPLH